METKFSNKKIILTVDAVIFLFCLVGFYQLLVKPSLPVKFANSNQHLTINDENISKDSNISLDTLISLNSVNVSSLEEIEILLNKKRIGDNVTVEIKHSGEKMSLQLIPFYSNLELTAIAFVGLLFIFFGIFVLLKCFKQVHAHVFHWCCIATASIMCMSWGAYGEIPDWLGFLTLTGYHIAYSFVPAAILHFTLLFPNEKFLHRKQLLIFLYTVSAVFALTLSIRFVFIQFEYSEVTASNYILLLTFARGYIGVVIIGAVAAFIHSYNCATERSEKKKLLWIMLGFLIGPLSYVVLWIAPYSIIGTGLIPEIAVILLMSAIPITFSISIIKHNLMDIHLLIKRGVVYSLVIAAVFIIYTGAFALFASEVINQEYPALSVIGIVLIVIIFQPVKRQIHKFVDKKFFRVDYNFRIALVKFTSEIEKANNINTLAKILVESTNTLIPVNKLGFFILKLPENRIRLLEHIQFEKLSNRSFRFKTKSKITDLSLPAALPNKVEHGANVEIANFRVFKRQGIDIVFPIRLRAGKIFGFLVLGGKKSGAKFSVEDVDLLNSVLGSAAAAFERIYLQEEIIKEHLEAEKQSELSKLKSYYVQSVSHELKTPLASIKLFAELLKKNITAVDSKSNEYLEIIEGESERLKRLINNVLDYSKIERGVKNYSLQKTNLAKVIEDVLNSMEYLLKINGFKINFDRAENEVIINADRDAVVELLINLLSNSIKYSDAIKSINIEIKKSEYEAILIVEDKGIGIAKENQSKIFEPFFRVTDFDSDYSGGAGLGMSIVKHIMDAHNGIIKIESELGKGTKFILTFPSGNENEKNIIN